MQFTSVLLAIYCCAFVVSTVVTVVLNMSHCSPLTGSHGKHLSNVCVSIVGYMEFGSVTYYETCNAVISVLNVFNPCHDWYWCISLLYRIV